MLKNILVFLDGGEESQRGLPAAAVSGVFLSKRLNCWKSACCRPALIWAGRRR
jgi:hypothetical protein